MQGEPAHRHFCEDTNAHVSRDFIWFFQTIKKLLWATKTTQGEDHQLFLEHFQMFYLMTFFIYLITTWEGSEELALKVKWTNRSCCKWNASLWQQEMVTDILLCLLFDAFFFSPCSLCFWSMQLQQNINVIYRQDPSENNKYTYIYKGYLG